MYLDLFLHHYILPSLDLRLPTCPWVLQNKCFMHLLPAALGRKEIGEKKLAESLNSLGSLVCMTGNVSGSLAMYMACVPNLWGLWE